MTKEQINARVQSRYDELRREGKHGHYESMFRLVHEEMELLAERNERLEREMAREQEARVRLEHQLGGARLAAGSSTETNEYTGEGAPTSTEPKACKHMLVVETTGDYVLNVECTRCDLRIESEGPPETPAAEPKGDPCQHDPFHTDCTVDTEPDSRGTMLRCRICQFSTYWLSSAERARVEREIIDDAMSAQTPTAEPSPAHERRRTEAVTGKVGCEHEWRYTRQDGIAMCTKCPALHGER